jgi:hypothetical protein
MTGELPDVTDDLLAALEFRYAQPRVCRVCGAPLHVVDSRGMKMTCTSDAASPYRNRYEAAGVTRADALDHWDKSTMWNPPDGDVNVLAVVRELRRLREHRPTRGEAFDLADQSIGLFLEFRDQHGHDEQSARVSAALEVAEGASLTGAELGG